MLQQSLLILCLTVRISLATLVVACGNKTRLNEEKCENKTTIEIYQMKIRSDIKNRFATTTVTSRVRNFANLSQEAEFSVILPNTAFISGFVMQVDGKNYTAYVKAKEEAKRVYDEAIASGLGAAHVAVSARDSNRFTVLVNVEPGGKASFYLTYEQLLQRQDGHYEQIINIHPGQPVKDLGIEVVIAENRRITELKAPPLRSGNEILKENPELDPRADLEIFNTTAAIVRFSPNVKRQKQLAHIFATAEGNGFAGQFVVQYDVERDPYGGELLTQDGYFVQFFAPTNLRPLPKQVIFVLDTSGSMWGSKIRQVKDAMVNILDQLHIHDSFSLVEFNSDIRVWDLNNPERSILSNLGEKTENEVNFPPSYLVNANNIEKAKQAVLNLKSEGSTSMYGSLRVALHLVKPENIQSLANEKITRQPIIIFLTDGQPTDSSTEHITTNITKLNLESRKTPIFSLSFGAGADKEFLQTFSLRNSAFSKHIYEATDASLQLQDFYQHISSPLLSNVKFKYAPTVTSLTRTNFPIHFNGSEIVVCGNYGNQSPSVIIGGYGVDGGEILFEPSVSTVTTNVERIWAYMMVSQLIETMKYSDNGKEELKQKALNLALKYSFVTPLSSLVVVKPNSSSSINTEEASDAQHKYFVDNNSYKGSGGHSVFKNKMEHKIVLLILSVILIAPFCEQALVVSSTEKENVKENEKDESTHNPSTPQIYQMKIRSNVNNRFANTTVISKVRNFGNVSQEAVFSIVLPETAFISGFVMEVGGKNYTAYVKAKEEAKQVYDEAVSRGFGAAHVAVSARDSNRFTVSVNIEPEAKSAFYLTYEQLLQREDGHYEQIINIHPGQPVKDLSVEIVIAESRKIVDLKAPPLRSGNEIGKEDPALDPRADIEIVNDTLAIVRFMPNIERQKEVAHIFGTKEDYGLSGQFIVQYDVERDPHGGEILIQDGYFVHFFAPTNLKPIPKQVIFVLDTSGSMWGSKIKQLKEAMVNILEQLNDHDSFNLLTFSDYVKVWTLDSHQESDWYIHNLDPSKLETLTVKNSEFPSAKLASANHIKKAKHSISELESDGSTSMYGALQVALHLVDLEKVRNSTNDSITRQPIIIFLTDGEPTDASSEEIIRNITEVNSGLRKSPIFSLSFGDGADKEFLQTFSLRNSAFSKHIYEAADASVQLEDFYRHISSPLLSDVKFKYAPSVTSLTRTDFPIHFAGSEIVVCGLVDGEEAPTPTIDGYGESGLRISLKPTISTAISNIERLWAYLSITQLLQEKEYSDNKKEELKQKALNLAIKYSFVTSVSSLVVVKPNDTKAVDTQSASQDPEESYDRLLGGPASSRFGGAQYLYNSAFEYEAEDVADYSVSHMSVPTSIVHSLHVVSIVNSTDTLPLDLPWLNTILQNGFINLANGTYKLGANETFSEIISCPKTPLQQEGHCSLLHECKSVYTLLKTPNDLMDHFCILRNEYAGVCCPNSTILDL